MALSHPAESQGVTLLRVSLGVMWISHAMLKVLVFTLPGTAKFFDSVGLPGVLAYPVFGAEILGGLALILGIYARQASLALTPIMAVAAWVHFPNGGSIRVLVADGNTRSS